MKLTIFEWIFDREAKKPVLRAIQEDLKVKYDQSLDNYYTNYKNAVIPLKLDYIVESKGGKLIKKNKKVLNVINYENSFVPFNMFEMEINQIDNIVTKNTQLVGKIKAQLDEVKALEETREKLLKYKALNVGNETKVKEAEKRIEDIDKKISMVKPPKEYMIKACSMPMSIRSWYIQHLKRLNMKHAGFLGKYGNVILLILFMVMSIGIVYVAISTTAKGNTQFVEALSSSISEGIKSGLTSKAVTTPVPIVAP